ncbi:MAG TPA: nuclear transport factor 2 family protein [Pirellulaceae bacterium]
MTRRLFSTHGLLGRGLRVSAGVFMGVASTAAVWGQVASPTRRAETDVVAAIQNTLELQVRAWNLGDLEGFMQYYDSADELTFSAGGTTTRGWTAIRDRYRLRYADRQQMGQLAFQDLEIHPLGSSAAYVLGRYQLTKNEDLAEGNFTLILRGGGGKWRIVHDHTSSGTPAPRTESASGDESAIDD